MVELRKFVRVKDHKIALLDINFELNPEWVQRELFVCADICSASLVGDSFMPVLRRVRRPKTLGFAVPYYMDVDGDFINTIHIYIMDEEGRTPSFSSQISTLHCTSLNSITMSAFRYSPYLSDAKNWAGYFTSPSKCYRTVHVIPSSRNAGEKVLGLKLVSLTEAVVDQSKQAVKIYQDPCPLKRKKKNNGGGGGGGTEKKPKKKKK